MHGLHSVCTAKQSRLGSDVAFEIVLIEDRSVVMQYAVYLYSVCFSSYLCTSLRKKC